jgi:ABC-type Fe3+-hydroxamate transport system substrate-binding protein
MARGDSPAIVREKPTPPEGIPSPEKVLMVHPSANIGYRWIPKELQAKNERWGYTYVRDYEPTDEIGKVVNLADLSSEELEKKAKAILDMAKARKTEEKVLTKTEEIYRKAKAEQDAVLEENEKRSARRGLKK